MRCKSLIIALILSILAMLTGCQLIVEPTSSETSSILVVNHQEEEVDKTPTLSTSDATTSATTKDNNNASNQIRETATTTPTTSPITPEDTDSTNTSLSDVPSDSNDNKNEPVALAVPNVSTNHSTHNMQDEIVTTHETNNSRSYLIPDDKTHLNAQRRFFTGIAEDDLILLMSSLTSETIIRTEDQTFDHQSAITNYVEENLLAKSIFIYRAIETDDLNSYLVSVNDQYLVYDFLINNDSITRWNVRLATSDDLTNFESYTLEHSSLLPIGFQNYLSGVESDNMDTFLAGFVEDAEVIDVSRSFKGREAIKGWANREVLFLLYSVGRIEFKSNGIDIINNIRFNESSEGFYGSYDMQLVDDLIYYVNMQYSSRDAFDY